MSLYEYELYLIREADRGEIAPDLQAANLVETTATTAVRLPFGVHAEWSESTWHRASRPLQILTLALETSQFEDVLKLDPSRFVQWLWATAEQLDIAYAFMAAGSYSAYFEAAGITAAAVFDQVGQLVDSGAIQFVHPVMYFAQRLGAGRACMVAREAPIYRVECRPQSGCLLLLVDGDLATGPVEILDPGAAYPEVARHFLQSAPRGRE